MAESDTEWRALIVDEVDERVLIQVRSKMYEIPRPAYCDGQGAFR